MNTKLTKRTVDSVSADGSDKRIFDSEIPGFHIRVKASGTKSYGLRYRVDGRVRNVTIGRHGPLTAEQARNKARTLWLSINNGADPASERQKKSAAPTLSEFWDIYLDQHAAPRKAPSSVKNDKLTWRLYIEPRIGRLKLSSVTKPDIVKLHGDLVSRSVSANRALSLLSKMMNLAVEWGYRSDNPCKGVKKYKEHPRHRYLTSEERLRLAEALSKELDQAGAVAIWLCMLTGARKGEVLQARWDQFDLTSKQPVWQLPAELTKQRRVNRKPLSAKAVALLSEWKPLCPASEAGWVIPGKDPERQRYDLKGPWERIRKAAKLNDVRLHDLRHDFASMAVAEGWSLEIIGRYMGHSSIQTTQRYAHLQDDPLFAMAEQIGNKFK